MALYISQVVASVSRTLQGFTALCWIPGLSEKSTENENTLHVAQEELRSYFSDTFPDLIPDSISQRQTDV